MDYNNNNRSDPANRPNEEMKQVDSDQANRLIQAEAIRRHLERLNNHPSHLLADTTNNVALPPQLMMGNAQVDLASRLAMEQALLEAQQRGINPRTSSFWRGLNQQPGSAASAALADSTTGGGGFASHLLGRIPSPVSQLRMFSGDNRHQLAAENLMLQQQQQQQRQSAFLGAGALSPATAALSNANAFAATGHHTSGMAFLSMDGNQSIHSQSGSLLEGRIAPQVDLDSAAIRARSSSAGELKEEEEKGTIRPADEGDQDDDDEEGSDSDREEDALDDDAFYQKRNAVETVEDLHLQNETFPVKLYRMLYEVEKAGKADVVSFLPHGRAFSIHNQNDFSTILPEYFSTDRMASFQRQLNLYGFRRITEGKDKGAFFHEKFLRGKRSLCKKIKRKRGSRRSSSSIRRGSQTMTSSSQPSLLQQGSPEGRLSANAWGRSIAAGQGSAAGGSLAFAGPDDRGIMLGSSLGSGSDLLGMGGAAGRGLNSPLPTTSSSILFQQQQLLQQRLRQQQELEHRLMLERERARRRGSQHDS